MKSVQILLMAQLIKVCVCVCVCGVCVCVCNVYIRESVMTKTKSEQISYRWSRRKRTGLLTNLIKGMFATVLFKNRGCGKYA